MKGLEVRQAAGQAGVCEEGLPWIASKVRERIGWLKNQSQDARGLHRDGKREEYEFKAAMLYGKLREAWERALEEVLFGGVVERFRRDVQTGRILKIADILPGDCEAVDRAVTKCSELLPGHDDAPAAPMSMPAPEELQRDICELDAWVTRINKRRQERS